MGNIITKYVTNVHIVIDLNRRGVKMKDYLNIINDKYVVRKSKTEKKQFQDYVLGEFSDEDYQVKVEELDKKHQNIVIGNIEKARVIFTAHYDTPAASLFPNLMMPRNPFLVYLYQFGYAFGMALISFLVSIGIVNLFKGPYELTIALYLVLYLGSFMLMTRVFPNKHNKNDNTSGVATVLSLLNKKYCDKVAFILFDNEEKGLLGSKAFNKKYSSILNQKLVINLDCVGNGDHILFISKPEATKIDLHRVLQDKVQSNDKYQVHFYPLKGSCGNSDHKNFKCGVGVMACHKKKIIGFYTSKIHTKKDTIASFDNIEFITTELSKFIDYIL